MKRKNNETGVVIGIISLIINSIVLSFNLLMFIPMVLEQIEMGKGTNIELGYVFIVFIDFFLILFLIISLVLTIISIITKDNKWRIILNFSFMAVSLILMVLTQLFVFF